MKDYDVVVVGLGTAGTAAALTAARLGLKVLGVERTNAMGGQATSGCICLDRTPVEAAIAYEREAERLKVERVYETTVLSAKLRKARLVSVTLVSRGRMWPVAAKVFVDATGNATLPRLAGLPLCRERGGKRVPAARAELWRNTRDGAINSRYSELACTLVGTEENYSDAVKALAVARVKGAEELGKDQRLLQVATIVGAREELGAVTETVVAAKPKAGWAALPCGAIVAKGATNLLVPSKHCGVTRDTAREFFQASAMRFTGIMAACAAHLAIQARCAALDVPADKLKALVDRELAFGKAVTA